MKLPYVLLLDLVETTMTAEEAGDLLTMAGFELEELFEAEGDPVLDIKVMSNRGDGLSALGLAREVLAKRSESQPTKLYQRAVERFPRDEADSAELPSVEIQTPACGRYACRLFRNVQNGESPEWLQKRLRQAGMRPISLLVDLTNYVMLEQGQPLHAFDFEKLTGGRIIVREPKPGERLTTLNGDEHELRSGQMLICDAARPVAVAGVMGGLDTEVGPDTQTMLLESAHFLNTSVRRTRKQLGLSTEASYRFERYVDPDGVVAALNRFTELYESIAGSEGVVPGITDVFPGRAAPRTVSARLSRIEKLMGYTVGAEAVRRNLSALGFGVEGSGEPFAITAPSWRPDVVREEDVTEEVGRVHGFEMVEERLPTGTTTRGGVRGMPGLATKIRQALLRAGFSEIASHSLRQEGPLDRPRSSLIGPKNPASPEYAVLRSSLLGSLADAALRNRQADFCAFELGSAFWADGDVRHERKMAAMLAYGGISHPHWAEKDRAAMDFYGIKGVVDELIQSAQVDVEWSAASDPRFHPTRQASAVIGVFGQIHPDVAESLGLPESAVLAEIDLVELFALTSGQAMHARYRPISRNPSVRRDLSLLVDKDLAYAKIESCLSEACGAILERQWLFDVYEGQHLPAGKRSLAVALQLRKIGENLTDEEANQVRDSAVAALGALGVTLR